MRLVLGTADLLDDAVTPRLLDQFVEAGGRTLDVANVYSGGSSQRAMGRWLRRRGPDVRLYAKGCHPPECAPSLVRPEVEKARGSLGVDRLDAFLLHRDDPAVPVATWAEALNAELERGGVATVGVSNWTEERFDALRELLGDRAATFSNHFSLAEPVEPPWPGSRSMDATTATGLAASGVTVLAWASLAGGYLAGADKASADSWDSRLNAARRTRGREVADELGTSLAAVAVAYVLAHDGVRPVVGTRSLDHLTEVLGAEELDLTRQHVAYLEQDRS
jgi:aryl-alcohol dehydrogenase-like predicted oxidoreductase